MDAALIADGLSRLQDVLDVAHKRLPGVAKGRRNVEGRERLGKAASHGYLPPPAPCPIYSAGRLAADAFLANRVRSGRKQP